VYFPVGQYAIAECARSPKSFLQDTLHEWQTPSIPKLWQTQIADDGVDFFLCLGLAFWV
jgi:hypothetical protein